MSAPRHNKHLLRWPKGHATASELLARAMSSLVVASITLQDRPEAHRYVRALIDESTRHLRRLERHIKPTT